MTNDATPNDALPSGESSDAALDELASAYLDGECTPAEAARVEADPALLARVEQLRSFSALLAAPVSVPTDGRESAIAAALGAFEVPLARPVNLAAERERRRPWLTRRSGSIAAAVAAAAVVVALGTTGGFQNADSGSDESADASLEETAREASADAPPDVSADEGAVTADGDGGIEASAFDSTEAPADEATEQTAAPELASALGVQAVTDLGEFISLPQLEASARVLVIGGDSPDAGSPSAESDGSFACDAGPLAEGAAAVATATVAGDPVVIYRFSDPGGVRLLVLRAEDCANIATIPLDGP